MRKSEVSLSLVLAGIDQFPCRYENDGNAGCSNGAACSEDSDCSTGNTCALAIVKTVVDDDADDAASVYAGDLNGDNAVTASDLLLLLASFGEVC